VRPSIAEIVYKNNTSWNSEFSQYGGSFQHVENIYSKSKFQMADATKLGKVLDKEDKPETWSSASILNVYLNRYFGAWQIPQKRRITEEYTFVDKKVVFNELINMQVLEGACLSALGAVSFDSETGEIRMDGLLAILAGGTEEAVKYLN